MSRSSFYILTLIGISLFAACRPNNVEKTTAQAKLASQKTIEIPTLLDRPEKIRLGQEWDDVQNFYGTQSAELRKNPNNFEARLKLAELFIQEARVSGAHPHYYPAAKSMLTPLIAQLSEKADPGIKEKDLLFRALSHLASVQLSLHDFSAALETAEKAVAINPHNAYIYGCLTDAHVELGNYEKAVANCDKMVGIRPDLRSYSRVSYLREIHGDVPGAIEAMDMAVKAGYPGSEQTEWARLQLGRLHERYGNLEAAEEQYKISLAARPDYPFAIAALADVAVAKGRYDEAEQMLKQAAEIIPEVGFYIDLSKIYQKTGRNAEAQRLNGEIRDMMAEDIAAGHNMSLEAGRFYLEVATDTEKALEYAQDEYRLRPLNKDVNQLLAEIYIAKGDKKQARMHMEKALQTGSKNPDLLRLKKALM